MERKENMKTNYRFKEKGHRHEILIDGQWKPLTGITTILKVLAKPALIQWAANMAVDYIKDPKNSEEAVNGLYYVREETLEQARNAHLIKRDKAGDIGKDLHQFIEQAIKKSIAFEGYLLFDDFFMWEADEFHTQGVDSRIIKMFDIFAKWATDNKVKFIESEKHLYSESLFLGGICDGIAEINGQKWLIDFKTGGKRIYADAFFQMGGYDICLNEMKEHEDITGYLVLGIFKDGTTEEKRSISNEENRQAFLSALTLYRIMSKIEGTTL
jgi:hypothetical protein